MTWSQTSTGVAAALLALGLFACAPQLSDSGAGSQGGNPGADTGASEPAATDGGSEAADAAVDSTGADYGVAPPNGDDGGSVEAAAEGGTEVSGGSGSPDAAADGSAPSVLDLEGFWDGTSSQGKAVSFVVLTPGIQEWTFGWKLPACESTTHVTHPQPVPIIDGRAMRTVPAGAGGITATVTIVFESKTYATGTIDFTLNPIPTIMSCSGHATATFEARPRP